MPDFDDEAQDVDTLEKQVEGITATLDCVDFVMRYAAEHGLSLAVEYEDDDATGKRWWYADLKDSSGCTKIPNDGDGPTPVAAVAAVAKYLWGEGEG